MKRKSLVVMFLAFAILLGGAFQSYAAEKKFVWKCQSWRSPAEHGMKHYRDFFEKTLPAMTDGNFTIKLYTSGELVSYPEILSAVQQGVIEVGHSSPYGYQGKIPVGAMEFGLPFGISDPLELYNFFWGEKVPKYWGGWRAIDLLRKEYMERAGVVLVVSGADFWPSGFVFNKPVKTAADIKGKKVRAGGLMARWIQKMGGNGVFITADEMFTALQTGGIDGATWGGAYGAVSTRLTEVAKNYLLPQLLPVCTGNIIVNKKAWDSLPKSYQLILEEGLKAVGMQFSANQNWTGEKWSMKYLVEKQGGSVIEWKGKDLEIAKKIGFEIWDEEAKRSPAGAEYVSKMRDYMKVMGYEGF